MALTQNACASTASGNVGIGTDNPDYKLHIEGTGDNLKLSRSGVGEFAIGVASGRSLVFEDKTAAEERMRIDSSGDVNVGCTDANSLYNNTGTNTGAGIRSGGQIQQAVYQDVVQYLNRTGNDGDIVNFRKDGVGVGSIGVSTSGDRVYFAGSGDSLCISASLNAIFSGTTAGSGTDNKIDIGTNNTRFKDFYLSGVATLGGASHSSTTTIKAATVGTTAAHYVFDGTGTQTGADGRINFWDLANTNSSTAFFVYAENSSGNCFNIRGDGDVENSNNSYGAISDEKLKENVAEASSQWDDLKAVQVRKYSFKSDNLDSPNQLGVIAQELEASGMGGLVKESPDVDMRTGEDLGTTTKTVKYSVLYMKAVKALQEAMDRIETLEAKVAALES